MESFWYSLDLKNILGFICSLCRSPPPSTRFFSRESFTTYGFLQILGSWFSVTQGVLNINIFSIDFMKYALEVLKVCLSNNWHKLSLKLSLNWDIRWWFSKKLMRFFFHLIERSRLFINEKLFHDASQIFLILMYFWNLRF